MSLINPAGIFNVSAAGVNSGAIAPNAVVSGTVASGAVMGSLGGGPFEIASGTIGPNEFGSGAGVSGFYASGSISQFKLASPSVFSGQIGSGQVSNFHLASGAVGNLDIASGAVGSGDIASGAVQGFYAGGAYNIASGTLGTYDHGSGFTGRASQFSSPFVSGTSWPGPITGEIISGVRAVSISQSGFLQVAMAAVSGRGPAIGVVWDNVLSGIGANVYTDGFLQFGSGLFVVSGPTNFIGGPVWLGRSGQVTSISGSFSSGGFASGDEGQKLGYSVNSGGVLFRVNNTIWSGGPLGEATGGGIL